MILEVCGLRCSYGGPPVLDGVSLRVAPGEWVGIIGPNGSGKSTLLRAISRVLPPEAGQVLLRGQDVYRLAARAVARELAVVGQETHVAFDLTVEEVVALGRLPHLGRFQPEGPADRAAVERAMARTGTLTLRHRSIRAVSGGERQRVHVARALAQEPRVLLLDEPTAHLDPVHQVALMDLIRELVRREGMAVVAVLHDLNLAARYCDTLCLMDRGRVTAAGPPEEVLRAETLTAVYGGPMYVTRHPVYGCPLVLPLSPAADGGGKEGAG